jgi:hypothetical protein
MSCESVDLKSYAFGEATREERGTVKAHVLGCGPCREELSRLELTQAALMSLRDEEIPRRIGFISDKEVAPAWWQFWHMAPHFVIPGLSAVALVIALLIPWLTRQGVVVIQPPAPQAAFAAPAPEIEIDKRVQAAVAKAMAASEQRTVELLAAAEKKHQFELRSMQVAFEEDWRMKMKQLGTLYVAAYKMEPGGGQQ